MLGCFANLRELNLFSMMLRVVLAMIVGGVVGFEREKKGRPAGFRTYMLVAVGATLTVILSQYLDLMLHSRWALTAENIGIKTDLSRFGAQVINGVGFLGAGTIIVTGRQEVKGLTTAAGLWAAAAVGLAIGIGFYEAASLGGCAIYVVLTVMHRWDDRMHRNSKIMEIYVELSTAVTLGSFIRGIRGLGLEIDNLQLDHTEPAEEGIRSFIVTLKSRAKRNHQQLLDKIRTVDGVVYLEEL